ncbi:MAG: hypothetical protein ACE5DI_00660 [Candidatus Micrarchaeia archaeon]
MANASKLLSGLFLFLLVTSLASAKFEPFLTSAEELQLEKSYDEIPKGEAPFIVVLGSNMNLAERGVVAFGEEVIPQLYGGDPSKEMTKTQDYQISIDQAQNSRQSLAIIGGPSQNSLAREIQRANWQSNRMDLVKGFFVLYGRTPYGKWYYILSDERGYKNLPREAVQYSPLKGLVPDFWIPIIASVIGAVLLGLAGKFAGKGKKEEDEKGNLAMEALAFAAASIVLGIAIAWTFAAFTDRFLEILAYSIAIALGVIVIHELSHKAMAKKYGLRANYKFWPAGSIVTLLTAGLGSAFGLSGYLSEQAKGATDRQRALTKLMGPLSISFLAIILFALNWMQPNEILQIGFTLSSIWAMAEILPLEPMDGKAVKTWSSSTWLASFLFILIVFFAVNFVL